MKQGPIGDRTPLKSVSNTKPLQHPLVIQLVYERRLFKIAHLVTVEANCMDYLCLAEEPQKLDLDMRVTRATAPPPNPLHFLATTTTKTIPAKTACEPTSLFAVNKDPMNKGVSLHRDGIVRGLACSGIATGLQGGLKEF
jgi:hypothetical protein